MQLYCFMILAASSLLFLSNKVKFVENFELGTEKGACKTSDINLSHFPSSRKFDLSVGSVAIIAK